MFRIFYCCLLSLIISLTLGQSKNAHHLVNYTPRRTYEQLLFEKSKIDNQYYGFNRYQAPSNQQPIESRSSNSNQNADESNGQMLLNGQSNAQLNTQLNSQTIQQNHAASSLILSAPASSSLNSNDDKLSEQFVQYNYKNQNNQPHTSYTFHQIHPQQQQQPPSPPQKQPKHSTYSNYNNQPIHTNLINKNNDEEHHLNHNLNHYDLDTSIYHNQNVQNYQPNNLNSRLHNQQAHLSSFSTTPATPILSLKNTKVDGKLSPTLIITLPKKRKSSNGKLRRFPFLKAIVNSFISTDRRTNAANNDQGKQAQLKSKAAASPKLEHGNDYANSNFNNQQQNQQTNQQQQNQRKQQQQIYPLSTSSNNVQLKSQQPMGAPSDVNSQTNAVNQNNQNSNSNMNTNSNENNLSGEQQQPKEELKLTSSEFDDNNNFSLPNKDEDLEDDEEDDFTEHSDAPRPANFDENQYYVESNKIKYSSGREPNKQNDNQPQSSNQSNMSNQNNQKKTNKYNGSNTSSDFESMTSEVIDQEENDNSDKRPSISVRSRGSFLISVLSRMMKSTNFTMITEDMRLGSSSRASCLACHALAALYLSPFYSKDAMVNAARTICISFRLQPARVCMGLIDSFKDDLDYIRTHTKLNRREMCGVIFGLKCSRITTNNLNWMISIPHRPNMIERRMMKQHNLNSINLDGSETGSIANSFTNYSFYHNQASNSKNYNLASNGISSSNLLDIVQITDIHVDPYYVPGSSAECGEPLCCRATSGPVKPGKSAGIWGDYRNCDTPINTLRNTLKQISDSHPNAQYWMWTGDIAPHDIWNITRGEIVYQLRLVSNMIKEYSKVPVFPVIGNHEGVPVNSFPPPEVKGELSVSWLYDEVAKQWSYWLPESAIKTLRFGGYYAVKVKPGFRIISLNTNYCTRLNPWTLYDPVDPGNQLKWLVKELHNAELSGDKVHILGHIPPDNRECTQAWLNNFLRIIDRFEHVVLAQYYGHTHRDEFRVLYSPYEHNLRPISVAYVGPSVTPFTENNPAYRVYSMNDKGYIQDHHTYYFNLTEANYGELGIPIWRHEYSATQAFPLKNLGPEGWHNLISRMMEDDHLLNKYHKMYFRYSQTRYNQHCIGKCRQALLSDLIVAHPLKTKPRRLFGSRKNNK